MSSWLAIALFAVAAVLVWTARATGSLALLGLGVAAAVGAVIVDCRARVTTQDEPER